MTSSVDCEKINLDPIDWPYLTFEIPGIAGFFKSSFEDFRVEEVPAYSPCGMGEHIYVHIEKEGMATQQAVQRIARELKISPHSVGIAGLKDARGIARQWLSVQKVSVQDLEHLQIPGMKVLAISRHRNKLRVGHLRGNHFVIKLRGCSEDDREKVTAVLQILSELGVPNYFGPQRFGMRGDNWQVGLALLEQDYATAARWIAGFPQDTDKGSILRARELFEAQNYPEASLTWPSEFRDPIRLCRVMNKTGGDAKRALDSLGNEKLWFYLTAFQSRLFNDVLAERLTTFNRVQSGDLAYKHENGAVFLVEDASREQARAARFEISPSGPLFGYGMTEPQGEPQRLERQVLAMTGLQKSDFRQSGILKCKGERRSLRFRMEDLKIQNDSDPKGDYLELQFFLPRGCYATAVLREIGKGQLREGKPASL